MTDPYFNSHFLCSGFQKAYESFMSSSESFFEGWPPQNGLAFGLPVAQTAQSNYLNTLIQYNESFHSSLSNYHYKKIPIRAIYSKEYEQSDLLGLSHKTGIHQVTDQNTRIHTNQSELRFDRAWAMAGQASSQVHFANANHLPLASTMEGTGEQLQRNSFSAGNEMDFNVSAFLTGESLTVSRDKEYRRAYERTEKRKIYKRLWAKSERGKAAQKAWAQSPQGKAYRRDYQKAYAKTEKGKAFRRAWAQSDRGRAYQRAYHRLYARTEKRKAYLKNYREALKKAVNDREQVKITGKQAADLRASNKVRTATICPVPAVY